MAAIEVSNLTYSYPGCVTPALKGVSLQVQTGELVGLVGANGAGKSTLLLGMAGLIYNLFHGKMQGDIIVSGMDIRHHSPGHFTGKVGLVLQNPANQFSGMRSTVYEEVAFGLENLGVSREEMRNRIGIVLNQVNLADLALRSPYTLSGGQQQRLALASMLVLRPSVLLLDEPASMLDPQGSQALFAIIRQLASAGTTVVIAGHQLEWIGMYAHRIIALDHGEEVMDGSPEEVLASPRLLQNGAGWLRYTHAANRGRGPGLWPADTPLPVTLNQAAAGFRSSSRFSNITELPDADPDR